MITLFFHVFQSALSTLNQALTAFYLYLDEVGVFALQMLIITKGRIKNHALTVHCFSSVSYLVRRELRDQGNEAFLRFFCILNFTKS